MEAKIPSKLIADSAAATSIREERSIWSSSAATGSRRTGMWRTLERSCSASSVKHGVPFYSVVPVSTIDFDLESGELIPIEERDPSEVTHVGDTQVAPTGMDVYNPAFDVTPHQNITGIITERGIIYPPFKENIARLKRGEHL